MPAFLLAFLLVFAVIGGTLAKYAHTTTRADSVTGSTFYFTSPELNGETYKLSADTKELDITLCNYADELRISDVDIDYSVTVDGDATISPSSGTIDKTVKSAKITLSDLQPGKTYTVTATATSPFSATLTGTFIVSAESKTVHYSVTDNGNSTYALLTVWTDNYSGEITVNWPAGLIPDSTDEKLSSAQTYNNTYGEGTVTTEVEPYSSYTFRFFKEKTGNYTKDITVTEGVRAE